jgi:serine/threonine protein kinase
MTDRDLFLRALDIDDPADRAAYLDQACANQPDLRTQVDQLLKAHDLAGQFLAQPHVIDDSGEQTRAYTPKSPAAETAGLIIAGKYKMLERIGEGGMGSVWMADQLEPVKRRVAVKLVHSQRDGSHSILARFEAERQAIALMDHPHIAKLLDAGTIDERMKDEGGRIKDEEHGGRPDSSLIPHPSSFQGRPFFVMELVKGVPLTQFCDEHRLSIAERLNLFVQICGAVQHAHQKGIIHRDLKPNNILVELHDDRPMPKVIDFGLAKALSGQPLTEHTLFTGFGTVAGTPLYMAPEQAKFNAIDIDTRADIYALGVILYELLTGSTPIERATLKQAALDEILRVIRESEPPTPSKRLSTTESTPSVAANRQIEPAKLGRLVRGELDWIAMKALAKERDRRYETASGLARDIGRYLNHEPVLAGPPSARYRLRKFVRRHRGQVVAASLFLLALVAGIAGTTAGLVQATRERETARANAKKATQAAEAERVAKEQEAAQRARAEKARDRTRQALDDMTSTVTGDSLGTQVEISADQKKFLSEVLKYYQEFAGETADDERARKRIVAAADRVGLIEFRLGQLTQAADAFRMARDGYTALSSDFPTVADYAPKLADSHNHLGLVQNDLGNASEAEAEYRKARTISEKLTAQFPAVPEYRRDLAAVEGNLGNLQFRLGKRSEAEGQLRKSLAIHEPLASEFPAVPDYQERLARNHYNLGTLLSHVGKQSEAEAQYRKALAIEEKLVAELPAVRRYRHLLSGTHHNLGLLLSHLGRGSEAEGEYRKALAVGQKLVDDAPAVPAYRQWLANHHQGLGALLAIFGRASQGDQSYRRALAIRQKLVADFPAVPDYQKDLAASYVYMGNLMVGLDQRSGAEQEYRRALPIQEKLVAEFPAVPKYRDELAGTFHALGRLLLKLGRWKEAQETYRRSLAIEANLVGEFPAALDYRQRLAENHSDLGYLLAVQGKLPDADAAFRKALEIREGLAAETPAVPEYRADLAGSHNALGHLQTALGRPLETASEYRTALAIREKLVAEFPAVRRHHIDLGASYGNVGDLALSGGNASESLEWFDKAIRTLTPVYEQGRRSVDGKAYLLSSHASRARALDRLRRHDEAIKDWDRAIELSTEKDRPGHRADRAVSRLLAGQVDAAVAEVAELTKLSNWSAAEWYNFACVYAVASSKVVAKKREYADRAIELLTASVNAGFKDAAHIKQDKDLDALRDRSDFKKLLAELTAGTTAERKP